MRNLELNSFLSMTWVILGHHLTSPQSETVLLLLKDLDRSNGWVSSSKGFLRMILFYVNRYFWIIIP